MPNNLGTMNEDYMVQSINNKTYNELNENLQHFLLMLFRNVDASKKFKCFKTEDYIKPDICVQLDGVRKFVSLKYGNSESVHDEHLLTFIDFLRDNEISEKSIKTYLLFHYGDGTTDGSGRFRMNSVEVRYQLKNELKQSNEELNSNRDFLKAFADRVVWQGVNPQAERADFLYHGDPDYGVFMNRHQLRKQLSIKNWDFMDSCVHVGPFVIRPAARYANKPIAKEDARKRVSITYPKLVNDILYISSRHDYEGD